MHVVKKLILCVLASALTADAGEAEKPGTVKTGRPPALRFSVLPKSLQENPRVDCNILTEITPAGKKLRPPTRQNPSYYVLQPGYYQNLGEAAPANARPPPMALLQQAMKTALATGGYLEADPPAHQPTLVIVFNYGDHSATNAEVEAAAEAEAVQMAFEQATQERLTQEAILETTAGGISDEDREKLPPMPERPDTAHSGFNNAEELLPFVLADPRKHRQVIDRAGIIGGTAFAQELAKILKDEVQVRRSSNAFSRGLNRLADEGERQKVVNAANGVDVDPAPRGIPTFELGMAGPFLRYYRRDPKTTYLVDEAFGSCYFVIASAFDGAAIAKGEKRLLWRTKMTVNSEGVALADTLPVLISSAGGYFGRETNGTVTVEKNVLRNAAVKVGTPTIVAEPAGELLPPPKSKQDDSK
ncbi:MAG TPA: hypothetical protein VHO24_06185 [Opitutaceae bacterium]|nr:hypothetical protein [Opitutaceae bacterium]